MTFCKNIFNYLLHLLEKQVAEVYGVEKGMTASFNCDAVNKSMSACPFVDITSQHVMMNLSLTVHKNLIFYFKSNLAFAWATGINFAPALALWQTTEQFHCSKKVEKARHSFQCYKNTCIKY